MFGPVLAQYRPSYGLTGPILGRKRGRHQCLLLGNVDPQGHAYADFNCIWSPTCLYVSWAKVAYISYIGPALLTPIPPNTGDKTKYLCYSVALFLV